VLPRSYEDQTCSIAGSLALIGDRWTLLVLRDVFLRLSRFDEIQRDLGIARNVLSDRLGRLVSAGVLERRVYQRRPARSEYRLTDKGRDLWPVLVSLLQWGDRYVYGGRPPLVLRHRDCGGELTAWRACAACGAQLGPRDVEARPGPAASPALRAKLAS